MDESQVRELLRGVEDLPGPSPEIPIEILRRSRRRVVITLCATVVAVVALIGASLMGARILINASPSQPADEGPQPREVTSIPFQTGVPNDVVVGEGAVWVSGEGVFRIDPISLNVVAALPSTSRRHGSSIAVGEGAVWVSGGTFDGEILRIDPSTNEVTATIHSGGYEDPYAVAVGAGSVWATTGNTGRLLRIDPKTNDVVDSIPVLEPRCVVVLDATIWVTTGGEQGAGLAVVDPVSGEVVHTYELDLSADLVAGSGSLWSLTDGDATVARIDPATGSVVARIEIGPVGGTASQANLATGDGGVWVADGSGSIYRIDPSSNEIVATLSFEAPVQSLAVGEDALWVADGTGTLYRIDPSAFAAPEGVSP